MSAGPRPRRRSPIPPEFVQHGYQLHFQPQPTRVAARVQQWNRGVPPRAGYVTLGNVRYGFQLASPPVRQESRPSIGEDRDCCCAGVQLPWTRARPPPVSRLPTPRYPSNPSGPRQSVINSHQSGRSGNMFRPATDVRCERAQQPQPVYRSSLEWSQRHAKPNTASSVVTSCFRAAEEEPNEGGDRYDGVRSPIGRRVLVRPKPELPAYFKLCASSASDSDTSCLLSPASSRDDLASPSPSRVTLDRLNRFRLGGSRGERRSGSTDATKNSGKKRSGDKTDRLRELTERLKGNPKPPVVEERPHVPPIPPPRQRHVVPRVSQEPECCVVQTAPIREQSEPSDRSPSREDDVFDMQLSKPESRTIVGSYAQRSIPFRSASFSQVDYSAEGKYIRTLPRSGAGPNARPSCALRAPKPPVESGSVIASAGLTLPRKRDGSSRSTSPSNNSDSADIQSTKSDQDLTPGQSLVSDNELTRSVPVQRPLTHPLPRRGSHQDDALPYTSIDADGMKSLQTPSIHIEKPTLQLEVVDESNNELNEMTNPEIPPDLPLPSGNRMCDTSSAIPQINFTECNDFLKDEDVVEKPDEVEEKIVNTDGGLLQTATLNVIPVYECIVREWSSTHPPVQWISATEGSTESVENNEEAEEQTIEPEDKVETPEPTELVEPLPPASPKLSVSSIEQSVMTADKPPTPTSEEKKRVVDKSKRRKGIYITQWPTQDCSDVSPDIIDLKLRKPNSHETKSNEDLPKIKTEDLSDKQWGDNECMWNNLEENLSPEDDAQKPLWPRGQTWNRRQTLSCQSSEEKDDDFNRKFNLLARTDSVSDGESDQGLATPGRDRTASPSPSPFDLSDCESGKNVRVHPPRRYSKRPLRGPYGQMLEAEMKKPEASKFSKLQYHEELKFLEELSPPPQRPTSPNISSSRTSLASTASSLGPELKPVRNRTGNHSLDDTQINNTFNTPTQNQKSQIRASAKRKVSANIPYSAPNPGTQIADSGRVVSHQRTTSSPSQLENCAPAGNRRPPEPSAELLAELLRGSSEGLATDTSGLDGIPACVQKCVDTRTHVVVELFDNERLYVEALQILVVKYLQPLKSPENAGLVEAMLVDEIFFMVPAILAIHEVFLEELRRRLEAWDAKQKVGDVFLKVFGDHSVMETYTAFINNWKKAKEAIKATTASKPAFARFIEAMARENKGKLALDNLLIKPVQKIPKYELLLQRLIKHTDTDHPDHRPLLEAQRQVHELLVRINCTEQQSVLRELEGLGLDNLVEPERTYLRHDLVSMHSGQGTRKERALFLFSDLLIITSIKRRSGTIRKPSTTFPGSVASTLEANKYKLLMRIPLDDLEIMKDETKTSALREMESLSEDQAVLSHISEQVATLRCQHGVLEDAVKDLQACLARQQAERQATDSQLSYLEMTLNTPRNGIENISMVFTKPEKRASWEEAFNEAKQKLALSADRRPAPEFVSPVPIRKTRAGLQFTCAAPTLEAGPVVNVGLTTTTGSSLSISHHIPNRDVWVCNSDGYVGQVCVLSLHPEPTVTSCNGVCNARILCVASVPAGITGQINSPLPHQYPNRKTGISISVEDTDRDNLSGNIQLDSGSSSEDEDYVSEAGPETEQSTAPPSPEPQQGTQGPPGTVTDEGADSMQPTMWLGTEDGCIHVYNCSDNIRIKKNKLKIQHASAVYSVIYLDNKVFVSLANGDISVYTRDHNGWNTSDPMTISVGSSMAPVTKLLPVAGRLWCAAHNHIKVLNTQSLQVERSFPINSDTNKPITNMAACGLGVWISLQNSAILKCFHAANHECLFEVNIAASVTKMLASCDDIIRQHKAACLRITALLACKDLLWVGTSAGVILTMPVPHIGMSTGKSSTVPTVTGVHHGHTGHVRFLTYIENTPPGGSVNSLEHASPCHRYSLKAVAPRNTSSLGKGADLGGAPLTTTGGLVISGGDGYEDFRNVGAASEVAGREDSTNHLLLWQV